MVVTGGSSGWQAPEQLIARSGGDARQGYGTDVFSFGMLLFYCLTAGKHPFGIQHYERDFNILQVMLCTPTHLSHGDIDCMDYVHQVDWLLTRPVQTIHDRYDLEGVEADEGQWKCNQ